MKKQTKQRGTRKEGTAVPGEWLYLAPEGMDAGKIAAALKEQYEVELWEEAGVIEVVLGEKRSMDMEHVKLSPKDEITKKFVTDNGCEEVFLVTFNAEAYAQAHPVMKLVLSQCGGLFCGDTEDFTPVVRV